MPPGGFADLVATGHAGHFLNAIGTFHARDARQCATAANALFHLEMGIGESGDLWAMGPFAYGQNESELRQLVPRTVGLGGPGSETSDGAIEASPAQAVATDPISVTGFTIDSVADLYSIDLVSGATARIGSLAGGSISLPCITPTRSPRVSVGSGSNPGSMSGCTMSSWTLAEKRCQSPLAT